ncbi:hypothetical protein [Micromonospora sp. NPDC049107]|uniref:hypothetical protein n=1 Tax=Micromonospora sp. NPDC049107 TaxID=3154349 RepID=UPI0033D8303F
MSSLETGRYCIRSAGFNNRSTWKGGESGGWLGASCINEYGGCVISSFWPAHAVRYDNRFDNPVPSVNALMRDQGCSRLNAEEPRELWLGSDLALLGL